ncbi:class I SAM-dependent methyltransferase [Nakamurella flava]|uniref:Class I SAM-dependent methyltransferase n=1 Tax=Nakamurella flava TaxID=2576308 RepID=A0A4U6QIF5_9ACTN|nr:class I SAM-dependent methyltransferase [Nakamurella flava]TKV60184.1 class I SAM-dependent methyltransferase [Nakamurella flava]
MSHPPADDSPAQGDQRTAWEARYAESDRIWSGRVNTVLADLAGDWPVGTALDLGCGEGGDTVWLAGRGWHVTGVDLAANAVERTRRAAVQAGVTDRVTVRQADLQDGIPDGDWDLVSAQFLQSFVAFDRGPALRAALAALRPGGRLLVVDHAEAPPWAGRHHHGSEAAGGHRHGPADFPAPADTVAGLALDPFFHEVELAEVRTRTATGPDGSTGTLKDGVVLVRRR